MATVLPNGRQTCTESASRRAEPIVVAVTCDPRTILVRRAAAASPGRAPPGASTRRSTSNPNSFVRSGSAATTSAATISSTRHDRRCARRGRRARRRRRGGRAARGTGRCPPRLPARRGRRRRPGGARGRRAARRRCTDRGPCGSRAPRRAGIPSAARVGRNGTPMTAARRPPTSIHSESSRSSTSAAGDGGREAAGEAVRAEADVARHDAAQGAGGEEELHLERAGEGDELEVAPARERERPGRGDGLAAEDGAAERDASSRPRRARRRRPSCRASRVEPRRALLDEGGQALARLGLRERLDRGLALDPRARPRASRRSRR